MMHTCFLLHTCPDTATLMHDTKLQGGDMLLAVKQHCIDVQ